MDNSFAEGSDRYALARPRYPAALFEWVAANPPGRDAAWDCGTGNGQAAVGLAAFFGRVEATDISLEQVRHGFAAPNVAYSAQPAEVTNFEAGTFDAVTVAQALHWFDYSRFWGEVRRVAKPGAFFCAWGYAWFRYSEEVEAELVRPAMRLLEPFWAAQNRILWDGYRDEEIGFPFERVEAPEFVLELEGTVGGVIEYLRTWSAYKRAQGDPRVAGALEELLARAGERLGLQQECRASSPLAVVAGRVE
jgi:hypothetical protein